MTPFVSFRSNDLFRTLCRLLCGLTWVSGACALELDKNVQVHGFVSQAAVLSNRNDVGGKSSDGIAFDLRELGGTCSWRPDPDWLISAQALMRWAGRTDDGDLRLDYGFVDRTLISGDDRLGIQLGKIKNPYGLYNTTRDVAHTRPGILMPQSIYLDRVRDFVMAGTGAAVYGNNNLDLLSLDWRLNAFRPVVKATEVEYLLLGADWPGKMKGRPSWMAQALLDMADSRWQLGLTIGEVVAGFRSGTPLIGNGSNRNQLAVLSLAHNSETWSLTVEYSQIKVLSGGYGASYPVLNEPNTLEAWYVHGTWRLRPDWQLYLRRDELYYDKDDRDGTKFAQAWALPAFMRFAKDWTLGVRHDLGRWALSGELHLVEGTGWLSTQDTPLGKQHKDWNLFLLQVAYRF
jgi:hypothetical protein